jgi:hypothetical protein
MSESTKYFDGEDLGLHKTDKLKKNQSVKDKLRKTITDPYNSNNMCVISGFRRQVD